MTKVYVNKREKDVELLLEENNQIVEYYVIDEKEEDSTEGNIYIGEVKNIVQGMQSFFVDIGQKKNGFLFFSDAEEIQDGEYEKNKENEKHIGKMFSPNQKILVQIKKEAVNTKGAKLTTNISLTGRYFILTPKAHFVAISKKIQEEEKEQYINLVKKYLPDGLGGIIRTNIKEASEEEIKDEIVNLCKIWEKISKYENDIEDNIKPMLIYQEEDLLSRTIRDILNSNLEKIYVNNNQLLENIQHISNKISDEYNKKIEKIDEVDLLEYFDMRKRLEKEFQTKVWLNCGGYLIINKTEALTAIDVNTGKYTGRKDLENTVYTVNKEAAKEVTRQMRLRNMGGIIIVDFIDMQKEEHKEEIIKILKEESRRDRSKIDIKGYTRLNLMEITRKKKNV